MITGIAEAKRIVDVRNVLTEEQKEELGGTKKWISEAPLEPCGECGCTGCSSKEEEPFEPYEKFIPNPFYIRPDYLSGIREYLTEEQVVEAIQCMFDDGIKLKREPGDVLVIDMALQIGLLEDDTTKLYDFLSKIGKK